VALLEQCAGRRVVPGLGIAASKVRSVLLVSNVSREKIRSVDLAGLDLFYRLAAEDGLIPPVRPLQVAP
jgi:hypothetical protein